MFEFFAKFLGKNLTQWLSERSPWWIMLFVAIVGYVHSKVTNAERYYIKIENGSFVKVKQPDR